jgi:autotransporter-associated beta strand protein
MSEGQARTRRVVCTNRQIHCRRQLALGAAALMALGVSASPRIARAADGTWNGVAGGQLWENGGNWAGGTIPGGNGGSAGTNADVANFLSDPAATSTSTAGVTVDLNRNVGSLKILSTDANVDFRIGPSTVNTGNTLYLSNGGVFEHSTQTAGVSFDVNVPIQFNGATYKFFNDNYDAGLQASISATLRANGDVVASATGTTLTLDGRHGTGASSQAEINGAAMDNIAGGKLSIVKEGIGTWEFNSDASRPSTYSGDTIINGGILRASTTGTTNGLGGFSPNSHYIVNNGGTLRNSVTGSTIKKLSVNFGGLVTVSTANATLLNVKSESGPAINLNFDTPTNTTAISLNLPFGLTGTTADEGGVLLKTATGPTGTGAVTFGSSTGFFNTGTVRRILEVGKGNDLNVDYDLRIQGIVQGSGGIVKKGPGTLRFSGHQAGNQSTMTGTIEVQEGTFNPSASNMFSAAPGLAVTGGRLLLQSGQNQTFGAVSMSKGEMTGGDNNVTVYGSSFLLNPVGADTARVDVILSNLGSENATLTKSGTGVATIEIAPTYTNATNVTAGKLAMAVTARLNAVNVSGSGVLEVKNSGTETNRSLAAGPVTLTGGAKIDLQKNKLITTTPAGTATGGVYAAGSVSRYVQTASNGGAWDGAGLTTSEGDAQAGLTSIGVAVASDVRDFGLGTTLLFGGQTITTTSTLAMYTYAGDANLDGSITGDDYSGIDFTIQDPNNTGGWFNGDFNYDGQVTGDDYSAIDFNILAQGAPFPTGGSASLSGVSAVPEPGTISVLAASLAVLGGRRRRRQE